MRRSRYRKTPTILLVLASMYLLSGCPTDEAEGSRPVAPPEETPPERDSDGDGWTDAEDCAPDDPLVFPEADERCNGEDDDCDGVVPIDETDPDDDGSSGCEGDCDQTSAAVGPGAPERCNGRDDDCDEVVPEDETDEDTDGTPACEGDCDDEDPGVHPAAEDVPCNGVDEDCSGDAAGEVDLDGDQLTFCEGDCEPEESVAHPGGVEVADRLDNDCNGVVDDCSWAVPPRRGRLGPRARSPSSPTHGTASPSGTRWVVRGT